MAVSSKFQIGRKRAFGAGEDSGRRNRGKTPGNSHEILVRIWLSGIIPTALEGLSNKGNSYFGRLILTLAERRVGPVPGLSACRSQG